MERRKSSYCAKTEENEEGAYVGSKREDWKKGGLKSIKVKHRYQENRNVEGKTDLSREEIESWYSQHFLNFFSHLFHGGQR